MKLVRSNGKELTVRDAGPVIFRLRAAASPLPLKDDVMEDADAKALLRELLASGLYEGGKV